jgi:ATP-dependent Lhr-like helicase
VRDKRWEELRPIQNAAISKILTTDGNYILASRTASGKTEAAFLPILSCIDPDKASVQVLYISPLKALINDQFYRVEDLCKYLDIAVTKWHGDANRTDKERLVKNPNGILLITPESLEAMLANKPYVARHLFSELKFTIIDEIHSFIGTDRGIHLKSLLSRLQLINDKKYRLIGLSATIGDYAEAKRFTGDFERTTVLLDRSSREVAAEFKYFERTSNDLPIELMKDLYRLTRENKVLIFPNSRGRTEEIAVKLKKISEKVHGHPNYFSHHSSVDKDVREYVEFFAKTTKRENFAISCTSTLELGIDIGSVDVVAQIDATNSVSSLIQRVGRSGRRAGAHSKLCLYSTDEWSLLQSLACWTLYREGRIDPPVLVEKPYDILLHQMLSVVKAHSGISETSLIDEMDSNYAFENIERIEIEELIAHLISTEVLEKIRHEIIIGIEGEKIVSSRNFYSVFETNRQFVVMTSGRRIGELPWSSQIIPGENIYLAARVWKILDVDFDRWVIETVPAPQGKVPKFSGGGQNVHPMIREQMLALLYSNESFEVLDEPSRQALQNLRKEFAAYPLKNLSVDRPILHQDSRVVLHTFTGSTIDRTLIFLFRLAGFSTKNPFECAIELERTFDEFHTTSYIAEHDSIDREIKREFTENPGSTKFSKWSEHLPIRLQISLLKEKQYDFEGAFDFLRTCNPVKAE